MSFASPESLHFESVCYYYLLVSLSYKNNNTIIILSYSCGLSFNFSNSSRTHWILTRAGWDVALTVCTHPFCRWENHKGHSAGQGLRQSWTWGARDQGCRCGVCGSSNSLPFCLWMCWPFVSPMQQSVVVHLPCSYHPNWRMGTCLMPSTPSDPVIPTVPGIWHRSRPGTDQWVDTFPKCWLLEDFISVGKWC